MTISKYLSHSWIYFSINVIFITFIISVSFSELETHKLRILIIIDGTYWDILLLHLRWIASKGARQKTHKEFFKQIHWFRRMYWPLLALTFALSLYAHCFSPTLILYFLETIKLVFGRFSCFLRPAFGRGSLNQP